MKELAAIADLPSQPAVYALYGGRGRGLHLAYIGSARDLRTRITQHLIRRDSSVTTGASVVTLNVDLVTQARWWEHPGFAEESRLLAAELIAFELMEPVLRSRSQPQEQARQLAADATFSAQMRELFAGEPTGRLTLPTLQDALERIAALEERLNTLEAQLRARSQP